jgi:transposase
MEHAATDYKALYEESLLAHQESLLALAKKEEELRLALAQNQEVIADLQFELDKFRKYFFGKKSEKLPASQVGAGQIGLFELGTSQEQQEQLSAQLPAPAAEKPKPKKRDPASGRTTLPAELRREVIVIEPEEDVTGCTLMGEEATEVLELIPAEFYVKRYVRPKYARPNGEGIIMGLLPDRVIDKGIPSESVLAQMSVDKYVYGLPLHRQLDKYTRMGMRIPASTASDWLMKAWKHLVPLWELMRLLVINQKYLQIDESPIKVLDRDHKNGIHQGYMWVYHGPADKLVLYDYRQGRDSSGIKDMLKNYAGIIQCDGYGVYENLVAHYPHIMLVYCMAHARRKFVDALKDDKEKATWVLERMQLLYVLEEQMRQQDLDWLQRTELRKEKAVPILEELGAWLQQQIMLVRPASPLGKAIAYAQARWAGLSAYALHGQIEIDNNLVENAIRPLAIGRKNYLFTGSHKAAEMTAAMYSFMATCKKNGVNEFEWLKDVLERLPSHKQKDLYQLLPNNWEKYRT